MQISLPMLHPATRRAIKRIQVQAARGLGQRVATGMCTVAG